MFSRLLKSSASKKNGLPLVQHADRPKRATHIGVPGPEIPVADHISGPITLNGINNVGGVNPVSNILQSQASPPLPTGAEVGELVSIPEPASMVLTAALSLSLIYRWRLLFTATSDVPGS